LEQPGEKNKNRKLEKYGGKRTYSPAKLNSIAEAKNAGNHEMGRLAVYNPGKHKTERLTVYRLFYKTHKISLKKR
jgi:hypothetical protein